MTSTTPRQLQRTRQDESTSRVEEKAEQEQDGEELESEEDKGEDSMLARLERVEDQLDDLTLQV